MWLWFSEEATPVNRIKLFCVITFALRWNISIPDGRGNKGSNYSSMTMKIIESYSAFAVIGLQNNVRLWEILTDILRRALIDSHQNMN